MQRLQKSCSALSRIVRDRNANYVVGGKEYYQGRTGVFRTGLNNVRRRWSSGTTFTCAHSYLLVSHFHEIKQARDTRSMTPCKGAESTGRSTTLLKIFHILDESTNSRSVQVNKMLQCISEKTAEGDCNVARKYLWYPQQIHLKILQLHELNVSNEQ